jgi:hypothetical protein
LSPHAAHAALPRGVERRGFSLFGWLRPRPVTPAEALEQRGRARFTVRTQAMLVEVDGHGNPGRSWGVDVINLSRGGAAVATSIFLAPGSAIMLHFPATKNGPARHIMAHVVHIRRLNELDYLVGLKFETFTERGAMRARRRTGSGQ